MSTTSGEANSQVLTFRLGAEIYALDVANAREIVEHTTITPIPKTPPWIRGVVNLRGTVVPVVDLRMRFGMGETPRSVDSCVVVTEYSVGNEQAIVGVLSDAALEVLEIDPHQIAPPPKFGPRVSTEYIRGIGRQGPQMFIILDIGRLFAADDMQIAAFAAETVGSAAVESDGARAETAAHPPDTEACQGSNHESGERPC